MAGGHGGKRPGAGRPKKGFIRSVPAADLEPAPIAEIGADVAPQSGKRQTPVEFLLDVMNDESQDVDRRVRAATALLRELPAGKKGAKEGAAKEAGNGKFGAAQPPRLVASNP